MNSFGCSGGSGDRDFLILSVARGVLEIEIALKKLVGAVLEGFSLFSLIFGRFFAQKSGKKQLN